MTPDEFYAECIKRDTNTLPVITKSGIQYFVPIEAVEIGTDEEDGRCYCYGFRVGMGKRQRFGRYIRPNTVKWFFLENVTLGP